VRTAEKVGDRTGWLGDLAVATDPIRPIQVKTVKVKLPPTPDRRTRVAAGRAGTRSAPGSRAAGDRPSAIHRPTAGRSRTAANAATRTRPEAGNAASKGRDARHAAVPRG
jgi:hypothetical protein